MITKIEPEPGGEKAGILRVELSIPADRADLRSLGAWFTHHGWPVEAGQISDYLEGRDWTP